MLHGPSPNDRERASDAMFGSDADEDERDFHETVNQHYADLVARHVRGLRAVLREAADNGAEIDTPNGGIADLDGFLAHAMPGDA